MFQILTSNGTKKNWKLGEDKPALIPNETVQIFVASETAYTHVVTHMRGIPKLLYKDSCRWQQPFAQFIFDNLPTGNIEGQPYQTEHINDPQKQLF